MSFVIGGGDKTPREYYYIRDADGMTRVAQRYVRAHPDWYAYDGSLTVNGNIWHVFVLIVEP